MENIFCNTAGTIRCVLSTKTKLSNVVLHLTHPAQLEDFFRMLQNCSNRKIINFVDILVSEASTTVQQLVQIENVKGLHLLPDIFNNWNNMRTFHHVRKLCLYRYGTNKIMTQQQLNKIVRIFPNLENLRLRIHTSMSTVATKDMVSFIIAGLKNLKWLYLHGFGRRDACEESIQEWDSLRSKLQNQHRLNIFFEMKKHASADYISVTIYYCHYANCPICNIQYSAYGTLSYLNNLTD